MTTRAATRGRRRASQTSCKGSVKGPPRRKRASIDGFPGEYFEDPIGGIHSVARTLYRLGADVAALSACIIAAQLMMGGAAAAVGAAIERGDGRKPTFLAALAVLLVRGVLFWFTTSPVGVVAVQRLDGVAAGIFGVVSVLIAAELMRGTGRFNLAQGLGGAGGRGGRRVEQPDFRFRRAKFRLSRRIPFAGAVVVAALVYFGMFVPETDKPV